MNIFDAISTGDIRKIIDVIDPAFKKAAREASKRAHAKGIHVADGRASSTAARQLNDRQPPES